MSSDWWRMKWRRRGLLWWGWISACKLWKAQAVRSAIEMDKYNTIQSCIVYCIQNWLILLCVRIGSLLLDWCCVLGLGSGASAALLADIARATSKEQRTTAFSILMSCRQLGLLIGLYFSFLFHVLCLSAFVHMCLSSLCAYLPVFPLCLPVYLYIIMTQNSNAIGK